MKAGTFALIAATGFGTPVGALEWGLETRGGYTFSDNVAQAPQADSASIMRAEVTGLLEHTGRNLLVDAEASVLHRQFVDDGYGSESRPQLRSELEWAVLPRRLQFEIADTYGQLALNPAEGLLPSEYEDANVFTAGPSLLIPLGIDTRMVVRGEYRNGRFEESDLSTERTTGEVSIEREVSRLISVFGTAGHASTDFHVADDQRGYDVTSMVLGMNAIGRSAALFINAGVDSLREEGETFDGLTYDVTYEHRVSRRGRVYLNARRDTADASDVFSLAQVSEPMLGEIRDVQVVAQPMQRDTWRVSYVRESGRANMEFLVGRREENFELTPSSPISIVGQDRDIREARVGMGYALGAYTSLQGVAETLRERFANGVRSNDLIVSLGVSRRLRDTLHLELLTQRIERSDSPRDFDELRLFATLRYTVRPLPRRDRVGVFDRALERRLERARGRLDDDAR